MSLSNRPFVFIGAIVATGLCLFLAFQVAALLLPFVLSGPYKWIWAPLFILLIAVGAFLRAKKRRRQRLEE